MMSTRPHDREGRFLPFLGFLLFCALMFMLNFMGRIILVPLLPTIERDLILNHGQAGSLFLLISIGYFATLLGSGFISSRIAHRSTIVLSSVALGCALLVVGSSGQLWVMQLGLLGLGMATGIYLPSGIATITSVVPARHWGKALAIHELAPNLSFVIAPLIAEWCLRWTAWRGIPALLGGFAIVAGLAFRRSGQGGAFHGQAPDLHAVRSLAGTPSFWIMAILFGMGISSTLGIYTMLPVYLVSEHHLQQSGANTIAGLSRLPGLAMAFVAGWASDRLGPRRTIIAALSLAGLTTVLVGLAPLSWIVALVFVQPALAVCFFPAGFAALAQISPPEARNVAVSLAVPCGFFVGAGLTPAVIGMLADAGSFGMGFVLVGGFIIAGGLTALKLRIPGHR